VAAVAQGVVVVVVVAARKAQLTADQEGLQLSSTEADEAKWRILARSSGLSLKSKQEKTATIAKSVSGSGQCRLF
jgi:hypothetical protein